MARENHPFERCEHPGRHGYTLPGEPEFEFCERCRRVEAAHPAPVDGPETVTMAERMRPVEPTRDWADPELGNGGFYSNGEAM